MPIQPESYNRKQNSEGRLYNVFLSGIMPDKMGVLYFSDKIETSEFSDTVREFQASNSLEIDGCLGPTTIDVMHLAFLKILNASTKGRGLITKSFKFDEFASGEKGKPLPSAKLMPKLRTCARLAEVSKHELWDDFPTEIVSGFRTTFWNDQCDGEKDSFHMKACASDARPLIDKNVYTKERYMDEFKPDLWMAKINQLIKLGKLPEGGYKVYLDKKFPFRHGDDRGYKARW